MGEIENPHIQSGETNIIRTKVWTKRDIGEVEIGRKQPLKRLSEMAMRCQTFYVPLGTKSVFAPSRAWAYHQFTGGFTAV